ncbi:hypothetical protein CROQUDRAFT_654922 [Cronartium quercuum f. sp. fusiforme G11]|uniref:Uncharacterized protein n=1 Tax=Cronartium quercuum f. sp. fusiforme G11 TaxID=708437 RepID=A0A9P6TE61_9BASI|nr:hypothetical protein CROQUDRAFT_654922 [Cronartium quercuum f. sp. fusiforme G11]
MVFDTTKNKLRMRLRSAMNKLRFSKSNSRLSVLLTPKVRLTVIYFIQGVNSSSLRLCGLLSSCCFYL